jgi:gluconolactonase
MLSLYYIPNKFNMKKLSLLILLPVILLAIGFIQLPDLKDVIEPGAELTKLADGFSFTEGPSADSNGNVYFTDQPNDRIMMWSVSGKLSAFLQPSGRSNGLAFDNEGFLWSCADEKNEIWRIASDKTVSVFPATFEDKNLNGPNDLWIDNSGGIYFTDPFYKRPWWKHTEKPQEKECVYYLSADRKSVTRIIDDLVQPNGIVGTPDGKKLFVADIGANKTWSYKIGRNGSLSEKTLFCELGSDGMTIDSKGNIYLTGNGVTIFNKDGNKIGNLPVPESWTANVCFGGTDMKSLFITASKGLYMIRLKVKGTKG